MKMKVNFLKGVTEEEKSLFCFGTALILLLAIIFYGVVPLMEEAVLAKEQCPKLEERFKNYQELSQTKDFPKIAREQTKKLQDLEKRLPKNLEQASLMAHLHSDAERNGVKLKALRQNGKVSSKNQGAVLYLECGGDYEKVLNFLRGVEREGSFKNLPEFVAKGNEQSGSLEVNATVVAYIN